MDRDSDLEAYRRLAMALGDEISKATRFEMPKCKFCQSENVVKNGHRKGTQYWLCKRCGRGFVANNNPPKGRYPADVQAKAVYDYYAGVSLNAICEGVKQATEGKLTPTDTSVYKWLAKYTRVALDEVAKHHPKVGKKWVMDETVVWLDGKRWWLITALDKDTRYLLGTKLSTNRNRKDIQAVLEDATKKTGTIPDEVLTDGWGGYRDAMEQAYGADSNHIVTTPFTDADMSTNLMERWNGTLKDRLKSMRGMNRNAQFQLILEGFVFFYNHLRPHMALDGKTPAEVAGAGYPFKSWGDVVKSETQLETLDIPPDTVREYRARRKTRAMRRAGKRTERRSGDTSAGMMGLQQ